MNPLGSLMPCASIVVQQEVERRGVLQVVPSNSSSPISKRQVYSRTCTRLSRSVPSSAMLNHSRSSGFGTKVQPRNRSLPSVTCEDHRVVESSLNNRNGAFAPASHGASQPRSSSAAVRLSSLPQGWPDPILQSTGDFRAMHSLNAAGANRTIRNAL
jgi:hypothetical protein